jgi:signal transduction histidine kinase
MFKTILRNLISNAIKFSPKNTSIEITLNESKKSINISVKDHGIGMSKEQIKKLFSLVDSESTRGTENEKGHGLGLVLCKEFINKHDGEIFVESKENMGSTFSFTIPKIL